MAASSDNTRFVVRVHATERIIEVVYPSHPNAASFDHYEAEVRRAVEEMAGPWKCLVDQRELTVAPRDIAARISALNVWALGKGMQRSVRVVNASAIAALQANRILRESGFDAEKGVFHSREEALAALVKDE